MSDTRQVIWLTKENIDAAEAHIERAIQAGAEGTAIPHLTAAGVLLHVFMELSEAPGQRDPWGAIGRHDDEPPF